MGFQQDGRLRRRLGLGQASKTQDYKRPSRRNLAGPVDQQGALADHLAPSHFKFDAMASRRAIGNLIEQLIELNRAGPRAMLHGQPVPQQIGLPVTSHLLQSGDLGRGSDTLQIFLSQLIEQLLRLRRMSRAARQGLPIVRHDLGQHRHQTCTQTIAAVALICVARILNKDQSLFSQPAAKICTRPIEQRPKKMGALTHERLRHGRKSWQARPSPKREQDSFSLIVRMLGQQDRRTALSPRGLRQGGVTMPARRVFRALAWLRLGLHPHYLKRDRQILTHLTAVLLKIVGSRLKPVMHMQRPDLPGPTTHGRLQQGRGISPAAVGYGTRPTEPVAAREGPERGLQQIVLQWPRCRQQGRRSR